jgi:hypothetical protein
MAKTQNEKTVNKSVKMPPKLAERIDKKAKKQKRSFHSLVLITLDENI